MTNVRYHLGYAIIKTEAGYIVGTSSVSFKFLRDAKAHVEMMVAQK